jgi:putative nucleotidyltransferase with HDIG domain
VKWTAETLIQKTPTVASLPNVYARLNEAVNDPRTSTRDVANVLNEDTGLAARLLRVANSAFYGFPSKIDTIVRAVTLVGTRQLRDLALATSVVDQFKGLPNDLVTMESFWRHSIACGVTARILATYRREPNVERFFIAGLMHDIGRLVMFTTAPELARQAMDEARARDELLHVTERMVMGFDHADVGGALLRQWKLPLHTVNAVAYHHRPGADGVLHIDTAIIHVADLIANSAQIGGSGERFVPGLDNSAWERLGLPESVVATTLSELDRQYHDAVRAILPDSMQ